MGIVRLSLLIAAIGLLSHGTRADDSPQWRHRPDGNSVSNETGLPDRFDQITGKPAGASLQNVKWVAPMGSGTFGSPVIAGGKVFVGGFVSQQNTATLWCFQESDGKLLWQMRSPLFWKLVNRTWGICSTPAVDGDRVYVLGQHGEVFCLDANGLNGRPASPDDLDLITTGRECPDRNQIAPDGRRIIEMTPGTPGVIQPTDARIIWRYDMLREVNCWPYNAQSNSILIRGDRLYIATGSTLSAFGKDGSRYATDLWKKKYGKSSYPSPSLIVLDKNTGKLLATDKEGIFDETFHGAHSSPVMGAVNGKQLLFYGGGNGSCYAFDPDFAPGDASAPGVLKRVWKFDCLNPATFDPAYTGVKLTRAEVVATPVFYNNRVYVSIGNDLAKSGPKAGNGRLLCLNATQTGDVTATAKIWSFDDIRNTATTVAIADGLLFTADAAGNVYCLDADTGKLYWQHETTPVWSSITIADGKVYVAARDSLLVFAAARDKKLFGESKVQQSMVSSPAVANGAVYIATGKFLYALQEGKTTVVAKTADPAAPEEVDLLRDREKPTGSIAYRLRQFGGPLLCISAAAWVTATLIKRSRAKRTHT